MITAIIRNKENTLVLELPHSIYDIYEKLQSIGIMQPPKQIPLTDNEDEDIGVKLFSESDFGRHLLLTLNEKNTIADANMLTLVIGAASEDIKEELEQNILYDQYGSMGEVISAVRQMTQDAGPVKAVFFCPLVGNIDEGDGDMFTVGDSYLADSADEIADALNRYTANDENDMATYYNKDDGVSEKLTSAVWSVAEYAEAEDAEQLVRLARNIGCFTFIEGATSYAEVGRFFTETEDRYILDLEMEDYFDYEGFGEYISDKFYGKFVCNGFIYNDTDTSLLDILYQDEPMTIGGM